MPENVARVWNTGTPENPIFNFELPSGAKGEPGGWNAGTSLGTRDLNTVTAPGIYYQGSTSAAMTLSLHYPPMVDYAGSSRGVLTVKSWSGGTAVIQEYTRIGRGAEGANQPRVVYTRYNEGTDKWSPWTPFVSSRVDNTAGRVVYMWDEQANREQMVYGDTGNRNISEFLNPSFQAPDAVDRVNIRRVVNTVTFTLRIKPSAALVGASKSENRLVMDQLPQGFREGPTSYGNSYIGSGSAPLSMLAFGATNTNGDLRVRGMSGDTWKAGEIIALVATWMTNEPWPTTLPGTPS